MTLHTHTYLGQTQSLCPECLAIVPAKIIVRSGRVYFRKTCEHHGTREDFVCSDVTQFDRLEYLTPGRLPERFGVEPKLGCPLDCGLCTEHEQHTCVGLVEINSACNLACPLCFAGSGPTGSHLPLADCQRAIDRLVEVEGRPEVLQLSGGEPTIHPQFVDLLHYAVRQPIDTVMINTNGLRLATDETLLDVLAELRQRVEVYLQFDGLTDEVYRTLRGASLLETKLRAVASLGQRQVRTTLVCTVQSGVNEDQLGPLVEFGLARPWITGISLQPATYSGRFVLPETLERRVTFPDVIRLIAEQTGGRFVESDFMPLPCAHPNCHSISYAYRAHGEAMPLMRFIDARSHVDLFANGIAFSRGSARRLIESYLGRLGCCSGGGCDSTTSCGDTQISPMDSIRPGRSTPRTLTGAPIANSAIADEFFSRALAEELSSADVFRITITSFLDKYNFDVRRVMKCCIHHVLPSGHVIPFCAYNVLYREGHVPLPTLTALSGQAMPANLHSRRNQVDQIGRNAAALRSEDLAARGARIR